MRQSAANDSLWNFPANREKNRERSHFLPSGGQWRSEKQGFVLCFPEDSLPADQGTLDPEQGIFKTRSGFASLIVRPTADRADSSFYPATYLLVGRVESLCDLWNRTALLS